MTGFGTCPKCGSHEVASHALAMDHEGGDLEVANGLGRSSVSAWVCGECGYVEYYAKRPNALVGRGSGGGPGFARAEGRPALPEKALAALQAGNVIDAIKRVKESSGLGLKESKDLVDAHVAAHPELRARLHASRAKERKGCLLLAVLIGLLLAAGAFLCVRAG